VYIRYDWSPSIIHIEQQHFGTTLGQHIRPRHVETVLGAALEVQAGAARAGSDDDMSNCTVVVRIALLENVDGA